MKRTMVRVALAFAGLLLPLLAASQTRFDHNAPAYVVPEKRVQIAANVTDPKGVKLTRVYFKTPAQADYVFVPMTAAGGNRFVATVPAINASAPSLQYVLLAVNNEGAVSKTQEYTAAARKDMVAPSWQSASNAGQMKVYTEAATAPQTVAGFSDSMSLDVAESTARFGATVGLLASGGGGAAGAGAAGSSSAAGGTAAGAAAGGLSTAAIIGGVAIAAGVAAAAAGSGGGGGSSPAAPSFTGTWNGNETTNMNLNCGTPATCTVTIPFSGSVNSSNLFSGTQGNATVNCSVPSLGPIAQSVVVGGPISFQLNSNGQSAIPAQNVSQNGVTVNCSAGTIQFTSSPRSITGSQQCTATEPGCNFNWTFTISGS